MNFQMSLLLSQWYTGRCVNYIITYICRNVFSTKWFIIDSLLINSMLTTVPLVVKIDVKLISSNASRDYSWWHTGFFHPRLPTRQWSIGTNRKIVKWSAPNSVYVLFLLLQLLNNCYLSLPCPTCSANRLPRYNACRLVAPNYEQFSFVRPFSSILVCFCHLIGIIWV